MNNNFGAAWQLKVYGIVQGIGFRPFVARLARQLSLSGHVRNCGGYVEIQLNAISRTEADNFAGKLRRLKPAAAAIESIAIIAISATMAPHEDGGQAFLIADSVMTGNRKITITPDLAVCDECLQEMQDPGNRRYRYPFINCTHCGPRYSIVQDLPYDRKSTTMGAFTLCAACLAEYHDDTDRRYHAQPNACPACGPSLALYNPAGNLVATADPVSWVIDALLAGKIVAVKSIGGIHLAVCASNSDAIRRLRKHKQRDHKPFALMALNIETVHRYAHVSGVETRLLESPARPIVLLRRKGNELPSAIAPRNPNLGFMLPSAPLHYLLLQDPRLDTLVMTSGNLSGHPIVIDNSTALKELAPIADFLLLHDRDIEVMVDDSVIRASTDDITGEEIITFFRRGRGYTPYGFPFAHGTTRQHILAHGTERNTTLALLHAQRITVSQHIGDVNNDQAFAAQQACASHLSGLLGSEPDVLVFDADPKFFPVRSALSLSEKRIERVCRHHAHMACCMVENGIDEPCLGVVFDGAEPGEDGTLRGGEFLAGAIHSVKRMASLRELRLPSGVQALKNPILVALSLLHDAFKDDAAMLDKIRAFDFLSFDEQCLFSTRHDTAIDSVACTSMGLIFDGVSALVGRLSKAAHGAQNPVELEGMLNRDFSMAAPYSYTLTQDSELIVIDQRPLIRGVAQDLLNTVPPALISRRFHSTVVHLILDTCLRLHQVTALSKVVLSGSVFLNEFLLLNARRQLKTHGFSVYHHIYFPPDGGGIAVGQVAIAASRLSLRP